MRRRPEDMPLRRAAAPERRCGSRSGRAISGCVAGAVVFGVGLAPLVRAWTAPGRATSSMPVPAVPVVAASTVTTIAPATTTTTGAVPPTPTTTRRATTTTTRRQRPGPGTMQYFTMPSGDADGRRRQFWLYR
ncbi:MAG: hypothetical protein QOF96_709, partial [Actinomycetota bacterium]|nr:hypothetical protein [Actinomycetota bacterium]